MFLIDLIPASLRIFVACVAVVLAACAAWYFKGWWDAHKIQSLETTVTALTSERDKAVLRVSEFKTSVKALQLASDACTQSVQDLEEKGRALQADIEQRQRQIAPVVAAHKEKAHALARQAPSGLVGLAQCEKASADFDAELAQERLKK